MDETNSVQPIEQISEETSELKTKHKKSPLMVLLLIILGVLLVGSMYTGEKLKSKLLSPQLQTPPKKNLATGKQEGNCTIDKTQIYQSQTNLNISGKRTVSSENDKAILNALLKNVGPNEIDGTIIKAAATSNMLAYLVEQKNPETVKTDLIYLHNLETDVLEKIYEKAQEPTDDRDYILAARDLNFSPDGTILAITTTNTILLYDIETSETSEIIATPPKDPRKMGIYAYRAPKLSENNRYISFVEAYYEGSATKVFDLVNNEFTAHLFRSYTSGNVASGWYGNNIIVQTYGENPMGNEDSNGIYLYDTTNPLNKELVFENKTGEWLSNVNILNNTLFYANAASTPSGYFSCNFEENEYEIKNNLSVLNLYDLNTQDNTKLITVDSTNVANRTDEVAYLSTMIINLESKDELVLLISRKNYGEKSEFYVLNEDSTISELVF